MKGIARVLLLAFAVASSRQTATSAFSWCAAPLRLDSGSFALAVLPDAHSMFESAEQALDQGYAPECLSRLEGVVPPRALRVFVEDSRYRQVVEDCVDTWNRDLGDVYTVVVSAQDADIVVVWQPVLRMGDADIAGYASWTRSADGLTGTIQLRTLAPNGRPMNDRQVRHAALHELGHLLGLADGGRAGEVMAPLNMRRPAANPSDREVDALLQWREQIDAVRSQALTELANRTGGYPKRS